ncbi:MBL fold metallo-hydrolase [Aliterella atlantica]|nr:MBL fold metallo-hydrolase [Aliterella atlantica]
MYLDPESLNNNASLSATQAMRPPKQPQAVFADRIFAFPPNRDTLGGTAYLIVEKEGNILLDCPATDENTYEFIRLLGGVRVLFISHRGGIGKARELQAAFNCDILIQEQEAYLLPKLTVTTFQHQITLQPYMQVIWTPGHSPGSSCLYLPEYGGILFTGRHLLPNQQGLPVPLRTSKTFHWRRQIKSIQLLRDNFTQENLQYICPGANIGYLRGKKAIANAYQRLLQLDLDELGRSQALI